jgi:hypothetical protein
MSATTNKVLYISFCHSATKPSSAKEVIDLCEKYNIGYVSRVDMLKRGAHVFVDWFYDVNLRNALSKTHPYRIMLSNDTWWNIFEARSALPEAKFNIHQLNNKVMQIENAVLLLKKYANNTTETVLTIKNGEYGIILICGNNGMGVVISVNDLIMIFVIISVVYFM